jgi:hypothetical protein
MECTMSAMITAYAIDALDEHGRGWFAGHLQDCPTCADEVRGERVADLSVHAAVEPPPSLRSAILSAIGHVRPYGPIGNDR